MAIAFDTAANQVVATATNTISMTLSGSSTALIAYALCFNAKSVTGITWNGNAMTQVATVTTGGAGFKLYGFILQSPTTGTANLVATQSSGGTSLYLMGLSYTGTATSGQPDAFSTAAPVGMGTSLTQTLTTIADNSWATCISLNDQGSLAASTNSTLRGTVMDDAVGAFDSNGPITPAGMFSMTQTGGNSDARGGVMISIAPAGAVATGISGLTLLGVGT